MRAHIAAIMTMLAPLDHQVHFVDVPDAPTYPYILLWSSAGVPGREVPLCDKHTDLDTQLGVTCVAATPLGVLTLAGLVRPILDGSEPVVPGRSVRLDLTDSRDVQVDRDVTMLQPDRHPAYGVDLYRLRSTPV